jgi:GntR family transcriptional regulator
MEINPASSVPLYIQIKDYLHQKVKNGVFPGGTKLPSERDLSLDLGVSRMTVRQALQALVKEDIIYSRTGKGYYACQPRIDQELGVLTSFSEEMLQHGFLPTSRVILAELQLPTPEIAEPLQLSQGAEVVALRRVRLADNRPIALENAFLVHELCPGILQSHDFNKESLYKVLREAYGCPLTWAKQWVQARLPTLSEQKLLDIDGEIPVLSNKRITYTRNDRPVEYVTSIYLGDRYNLAIILR